MMWNNATLATGLLLSLGGISIQGEESKDSNAMIVGHHGADPRVVKPGIAQNDLGSLLPQVDPAAAREIERAIHLIESSADPSLFVDRAHLSTEKIHGESEGRGGKRYGEFVFEREAQAVQILNSLLHGRRLEDEVKEEISEVIEELLDVDFALANTARIDAFGFGDPQEVERSTQAIREAKRAEAEGRYSEAIQQYQKGWVHAVRSKETGKEVLMGRSESAPSFALFQNVPNPFSSSTAIQYVIPVERKVSLKIYDIVGWEVRRIIDEVKGKGYHSTEWDGRDNLGRKVRSGIYFYRLTVSGLERPMEGRGDGAMSAKTSDKSSPYTVTNSLLLLK